MKERVRGFEVLPEFQEKAKEVLKTILSAKGESDEFIIMPHDWLPQRGTSKSSGYDIRALENVFIPANSWKLVSTGLTAYMLDDEELQIRPRSGLALKEGISVLNSPGTIDSDYYGKHIGVILNNNSTESFKVKAGDKIAQAIFSKYLIVDNDEPVNSVRAGGFGSTGLS